MENKLIYMIVFISFFTVVFVSISVYTIIKEIKKRKKSEHKIREAHTVTLKSLGEEKRISIYFQDYPRYCIIFLIILGLTWIGVIAIIIVLTIIGGFKDDSWLVYIIIGELFIITFNILPIVYWGYRGFAKTIARGATLGILTLSFINSMRGWGISEPPIDYNLLPARILMSLLTFVLPLIYILIWLAETINEKNSIERIKKTAFMDPSNFHKAYLLADEISDKLKKLRESGEKEEYTKLLDSINKTLLKLEEND